MSYSQTFHSHILGLWQKLRKKPDRYLQRFSHVSQILLCLFTGWALFYTVIPLYQKALLDETIARKEVELREATAAIAKKEVELKEVSAAFEKAYRQIKFTTLNNFAHHLGTRCSDFGLHRYSPLGPIEKPRPKRHPDNGLFELDVPGCIAKMVEDYTPLKGLRPEDRKLFDQNILRLNQELPIIRQRLKTEYDEVPQKAVANPSALPPPEGDIAEVSKLLAKHLSPEAYRKEVLDMAISNEQGRIARSYGDEIRQKFLTLLDTQSLQKKPTGGLGSSDIAEQPGPPAR